MIRFRFLLAWLLMAVLPLQGLAGATMLHCQPGSQETAQMRVMPMAQSAAQAVEKSHHDHSAHSTHAAAATPHHGVDSDGAVGVQGLDGMHQCSLCASCGNVVGIAEFPVLVAFAPMPQIESAEPFVLILSRPLVVAERPPRA